MTICTSSRARSRASIYYQISGAIGERRLDFEYYISNSNFGAEYYHFTMSFYEALPGVVDMKYYSVSDNGASATVGI
jgi:hypothetical protein